MLRQCHSLPVIHNDLIHVRTLTCSCIVRCSMSCFEIANPTIGCLKILDTQAISDCFRLFLQDRSTQGHIWWLNHLSKLSSRSARGDSLACFLFLDETLAASLMEWGLIIIVFRVDGGKPRRFAMSFLFTFLFCKRKHFTFCCHGCRAVRKKALA